MKKNNSQMDFLASTERHKEIPPSVLLVPTNRMNVLSLMSSGLVRPCAGYEKYYDDILEQCPGMVPIWNGHLPANAVDFLAGSDDSTNPVLVEIDKVALKGDRVNVIGADFSNSLDQLPEPTKPVSCFLSPSVIPESSIKAVHFRNKEDLEDFRARPMGNVRMDMVPLIVTPELFSGLEMDLEKIKKAFEETPDGPLTSPALFRRIDSAAGALVMFLQTTSADEKWVKAACQMLKGTLKAPASSVGRESAWFFDAVSWILGSPEEATEAKSAESVLLRETLLYLSSRNPKEGFDPAAFVRDVAKSSVSSEIKAQEKQQIEEWARFTMNVLTNRESVSKLEDGKTPVLRGVLLYILRSDPERVLASLESELNPGHKVMAVAAVLAGAFQGYSRMSPELRGTAELQKHISVLMADWCNRNVEDNIETFHAFARKYSTKVTPVPPIARKLELKAGKKILSMWPLEPQPFAVLIAPMLDEVGITFNYDFKKDSFQCEVPLKDMKPVNVNVASGKTAPGRIKTIRLSAALDKNKNMSDSTEDPLSAQEAIRLLEMNRNPSMFCRYAISGKQVQAIKDILEPTLDSKTLNLWLNVTASALVAIKSDQNANVTGLQQVDANKEGTKDKKKVLEDNEDTSSQSEQKSENGGDQEKLPD